MAANPNWARWIFASIADYLKAVAIENDLPSLVEHLEERTPQFMQATDRCEIRMTGPYTSEISNNYYKVEMAVNVLLTSRYDGKSKNAYTILELAGQFHEAMDQDIPIWNFGNQPGDYVDDDPDSQILLGCLSPASGKNDAIRVFNFGQIDKIDKLKQTAVDARYVMYLSE